MDKTTKDFVVITTDYATRAVLAVYGPFTREEANRIAMALPSSSTRDHDVHAFASTPQFNFSDAKRRKGAK